MSKLKNLSTENVNVTIVNESNAKDFEKLDVASSAGLSLPDKFSIPKEPIFAILEYKKLIDSKTRKARKGAGVGVILPDGSEKIISISSLTRKNFSEEIKQLPIDENQNVLFDTENKERTAIIDIFQDVQTFELKPTELINKYLAGKTIENSGTVEMWLPKFIDNKPIAYNMSEKKIYTVIDGILETEKETETKPKKDK